MSSTEKSRLEGDQRAARTFAIGDIHGCSTGLGALIEAIDPCPDDVIVVLGDFIDCGPDSRGVIERLIALSGRCQLVCLIGNHEEMLLNALESKSEYRYWLKLGGTQTMASYSRYRSGVDVMPAEHVRFIRGCQSYFETETHIFVHANYDASAPLNQTSETKLRWAHLRPDECRPHFSGKTVIVGHTPQTTGDVVDLGFVIGVDTDCYRKGWLTALDVATREVIQANQKGEVRRCQLRPSSGIVTSDPGEDQRNPLDRKS